MFPQGRPRNTGAIDEAERWVIESPDASLQDAADRFGISRQSLRARILNAYGSLAEARLTGYQPPQDGKRCYCPSCGSVFIVRGKRRMCDSCTASMMGAW